MVAGDKLVKNKTGRRAMRRQWILWPLAAAAMLVISVALWDRYASHGNPSTIASALPTGLENDLIKTHDHCCKMEDHQRLGVPRDDDAAIVSTLHSTLHQPVVMYHPKDAGWKFRGAAICPVGTTPSEHLVYAKGDNVISVFALPGASLPGATEGGEYSGTINQHCVVAFVKDGALFCVVGTGPEGTVSVDQLRQMTAEMKPAVAFAPLPDPTGVVLTELLRPVDH
jgi:hypothetical protein